MAKCFLPKEEIVGSIPITRSFTKKFELPSCYYCSRSLRSLLLFYIARPSASLSKTVGVKKRKNFSKNLSTVLIYQFSRVFQMIQILLPQIFTGSVTKLKLSRYIISKVDRSISDFKFTFFS